MRVVDDTESSLRTPQQTLITRRHRRKPTRSGPRASRATVPWKSRPKSKNSSRAAACAQHEIQYKRPASGVKTSGRSFSRRAILRPANVAAQPCEAWRIDPMLKRPVASIRLRKPTTTEGDAKSRPKKTASPEELAVVNSRDLPKPTPRTCASSGDGRRPRLRPTAGWPPKSRARASTRTSDRPRR